jgi:4-diphosphocytidyl-2-C-methyl-D-erythritol kinase
MIKTLKIKAHAKINLTLEILGKRPDGYHEIHSVIQTIDFGDSLLISPDSEIRIKSDLNEWRAEDSLIVKAVKLLRETTGCDKGAAIEVTKRIPLMAGLGGDSSDAAAVLRGLNEFWKLGLPQGKLLELARELGSDVSFFLYGGTALLTGRGENVTPLPPTKYCKLILIVPDVPRLPGKTKRAYSSLKHSHYTDGKITAQFVANLKSGKNFTSSDIFNTFENIFFARGAELETYKNHLRKTGVTNVHLAGTGPVLFTMLEDNDNAEDLLARLKNQGMEVYLTETC